VPSSIKNGAELTYKYTVINNGDSPATKVRLKDNIDDNHLDIVSSSLAYTQMDNGDIEWQIESLPAGAATEITYTARIDNAGYDTDITNIVSVQARETDDNVQDNSDTATVRTDSRSSKERAEVIIVSDEDEFEEFEEEEEEEIVESASLYQSFGVRRENKDILLVYPDTIAMENVTVTNKTSQSFDSVIVHDVLQDEEGNVIQDEEWDLGTVYANEEINISYDIQFNSYAKEGTYYLSTYIVSKGTQASFVKNGTIEIAFAPVAEDLPLEEVSMLTTQEMRSASTSTAVGTFGNIVSSIVPIASADAPEGNFAAAGYYGFKSYAYMIAILCFGIVISLIFGADFVGQLRKR
jgi:uncharacterized repeat protein (TIGR01451 family)